jgi:drug/metabolite transporter (DMT)-like permease
MGVTVLSFAGTAVAAREMSDHLSVLQMMFLRSVIGFLVLLPWVLRYHAYRTSRPGLHLARNMAHFGGQFGWTMGVVLMPLADVFALEFTTPIWVALLAVPFLGERITRSRAVAVVGGFIGVLVILRPGFDEFDPASIYVLSAAICFAASVIMVKKMTRTESALTVLFYMCIVQMPLGGVLSAGAWVNPSIADWPWLLIFGVGSLTAHLGMVKAFTHADATTMIPIDFLRVPLIALVGFLAYQDPVSAATLLGAAIVFGSNYYNIRVEAQPRLKAPRHRQ